MVETAEIQSVREGEYKETIITWRHLQNIRYAIIGASITGFVGLIGAFQLAFPREAQSFESGTAAIANPRLYILNLIPYAGMILGIASALSLIEWYRERNKVLVFGLWLEQELGLISTLKRKGFFTSATLKNEPIFIGSCGFTGILLLVSIWAWYGVAREVDAYKSQLPRPVSTSPIGTQTPLPLVPSEVLPKQEKAQ